VAEQWQSSGRAVTEESRAELIPVVLKVPRSEPPLIVTLALVEVMADEGLVALAEARVRGAVPAVSCSVPLHDTVPSDTAPVPAIATAPLAATHTYMAQGSTAHSTAHSTQSLHAAFSHTIAAG
jgi:hypothetical protein